jgi:hypothetical protein
MFSKILEFCRRLIGHSLFLNSSKSPPSTSIVFIVKNNQNLLEQCLINVPLLSKNITEVVIIDLGSIDNTMKKINFENENIKIYTVDSTVENNTCFDIIKAHVSNEQILIVDLNRIEKTNPNVYIPDLLRPVTNLTIDKSKKYDSRINGIKLLDFDFHEREKNSYILKEHVIEEFNSIYMQIELLTSMKNEPTAPLIERLTALNEYIDSTIKKTTSLINLIDSTKFYENNLRDDLTGLLKDFSQNSGVSIHYKVLGMEKDVIEPLRVLLLSIVQDLLSFILQCNMVEYVSVICKYRREEIALLVKYNSLVNVNNIINEKSSLRYFVLQSIQNRLNLIGGNLRIKIYKDNTVTLFIRMPILNDNIKTRGDNNEIV